MRASFGNARGSAWGMLAAAVALMVLAPAEADALQRYQQWQPRYSGGYGGRSYYGHRHHAGGVHLDGGLLLGILGLGLVLDAVADAQRPVVVYQPPFSGYQPPAEPYPAPYGQDYPPPRRDYPECREFAGNAGAMAFCEKGVLERENEAQRRLEQRAYEAGRGR